MTAPNLATLSPTSLDVRRELASTLDFVMDERIDLTRSAVVQREVGGTLIVLQSSSLSMDGGDLHIKAQGGPTAGVSKAEPIQVDGLLTGVVFEHDLDAVLAFRTGPLRNPTCRWQDYQELKEMLR